MQELQITSEVVDSHGITPAEHERIVQILGRAPNYTELGIFWVMWSGALLVQVVARAPQ